MLKKSKSKVDYYMKKFHTLDPEDSGIINYTKINDAYRVTGVKDPETETRDLLTKFGKKAHENITLKDFKKGSSAAKEKLQQLEAFVYGDTDRDGKISFLEIVKVGEREKGAIPAELKMQLREEFDKLDTDKDELLSFEEFRKLR